MFFTLFQTNEFLEGGVICSIFVTFSLSYIVLSPDVNTSLSSLLPFTYPFTLFSFFVHVKKHERFFWCHEVAFFSFSPSHDFFVCVCMCTKDETRGGVSLIFICC
jgi:hypothetical protein